MSDSPTLQAVVGLVRETLALAEEEAIGEGQLLFYDLDFTSLDLLDLLFRIEEHFGISIPEGTLQGMARGELSPGEFEEDGVLTERGRRRLMELLFDTPSQVFPERIHSSTLPRYCTVAAMVRLVDYKLSLGET